MSKKALPAPGRAHFIGLCGVGMAATAKLLHDLGWEITGSDEGFYPPMSVYLIDHGFRCAPNYHPDNIPTQVDLVVIGKHAKLIPETNAEVKAAFDRGLSVWSFPEVIEAITADTHNIVITGSFGKSTSAALAASCLMSAGKDPSYFLGAIPVDDNEISRKGTSRYFVLEGDEYPSANWDNRSKFLHYNTKDMLLISLEHDHVNFFPTIEDYIEPYKQLVDSLPGDGLLAACIDGEHVTRFLREVDYSAVTYSVSGKAVWSAKNIAYGETTSFDLTRHGETVCHINTCLLGKHNVQNIIGVSALLLSRELLTPEELADGIKSFGGLKRRLDKKTNKSHVLIYEGFGSSYAKLRAAIEAMRLHFSNRRLIIVFEPHTFSWRNREAIHWYDTVFQGCERVLIFKPPETGVDTHDQLSHEEIVERVKKAGKKVSPITSAEEGLKIIGEELKTDDVILLSTSGDLGGLIESIPKLAEEKFPK